MPETRPKNPIRKNILAGAAVIGMSFFGTHALERQTHNKNTTPRSPDTSAIINNEDGGIVVDSKENNNTDDLQEKEILKRGIWGICEYFLKSNNELNDEQTPEEKTKILREETNQFIEVLKKDGIIPPGKDIKKFSESMDPKTAKQILERASDYFQR